MLTGQVTLEYLGRNMKRADRAIEGHIAIKVLLLASFMVVFPSTDVSTATGNPFLGRYQSGRGDGSPYGDKEKYEHSKWHVHR